MSRRIFYYSILSMSIVACSGNSAKRATGDFEYTKNQEAKAVTVPEGLSKPTLKNDFKVAAEDKVFGPVGPDVDIRAPSLVLPIAASSRTVPESSESIIWFDKVFEDKDLKTFIVDSVKSQLKEDGVDIESESEDGLVLTSGWYHNEKESGVVVTDIDSTVSKKFKFEFGTRPHGRSVSVKVSLIDYMKTDKMGSTKQADPIDQQRAEMAMLNEVTAQVDYQYRLKQRENLLLRSTQKIVSISENVEGEPAYQVELNSELMWQNLPIFFERHGFTITDLNESKKIYFVDFTKPSISIWDTIWGEERPVIEFEDRKYQFVVSAKGESSVITIYDEDGVPLTPENLEVAFPVMEPGLSFR